MPRQYNVDPENDTRFKPGQSGNPGGKTKGHRAAEIRAAEQAAMVQADLVGALASVLHQAKDDAEKLAHIRADVLKLLKDAQDRGFGSPVQQVDNTSSDGSMSMPTRVEIVAVRKEDE